MTEAPSSRQLEIQVFDALNQIFVDKGLGHIQMSDRNGGYISSIFAPIQKVQGDRQPLTLETAKVILKDIASAIADSSLKDKTKVSIRALQIQDAFPNSQRYEPIVFCMLMGCYDDGKGKQTAFDWGLAIKHGAGNLQVIESTDENMELFIKYLDERDATEEESNDLVIDVTGISSPKVVMFSKPYQRPPSSKAVTQQFENLAVDENLDSPTASDFSRRPRPARKCWPCDSGCVIN